MIIRTVNYPLQLKMRQVAQADDLEPLRSVAGVHRLLGHQTRYEYDHFGQMTAVHREEASAFTATMTTVAG